MKSAATPYIAWTHLGEILLASLLSGIAIVAIVSLGVTALSVSQRDGASPTTRATAHAAVFLCGVACLAIVAWAFYLVVHKG